MLKSNRLKLTNNGYPEGESMRVGFDGGIKPEFHGANRTSNGGHLAYSIMSNLDKSISGSRKYPSFKLPVMQQLLHKFKIADSCIQ